MADKKLPNEFQQAIVDKNVEKFTKILAEDTDIPKSYSLYLAAKENSVEIAKLLLVMPDVFINQRHDDDGQTALHAASNKGHAEMVSELLLGENIQVNAQDKHGNTPLHLAAKDDSNKKKDNYKKVIKLLIEHHADLGSKNKGEFLPNFSEEEYKEIFSEQIGSATIGENKYKVLNFNIFKPKPSYKNSLEQELTDCEKAGAKKVRQAELHVLKEMKKCDKLTPELLTHPLVSAYLKLKRARAGVLFWYSLLLPTLLFLALILLSLREYSSLLDFTSTSREEATCKVPTKECDEPVWGYRIFLLFFVVCRGVTEFVQLLFFRLNYFKQIDNYFQVFIIIVSLFLVSSIDPDHCPVRRRFAGVLLPVLCLDSLKIIASVFQQDHKIALLIEVIKKFLSYTAWYFPLMIICMMSFYTIFSNSTQFSDIRLFGVDILQMVIGEVDFSNLCLSTKNDAVSITSYILEVTFLLFFIFIIAVVLMNMLNGLAVSIVSDQSSISEKAAQIRFKTLLKDLSFLEDVFLSLHIFYPLWKSCCQVLRRGEDHFYFGADKCHIKMILTKEESKPFMQETAASEDEIKNFKKDKYKGRLSELFNKISKLTLTNSLKEILQVKGKQNDLTNAHLKKCILETQNQLNRMKKNQQKSDEKLVAILSRLET